MYTIEYILKKAKANDYTKIELETISEAYKFAKKAHDGQKRKNGDKQIDHCLTVAGIVADLNVDATTIVAALIHETYHLSGVSLEIIEAKFGNQVKIIIDNLAKLKKLKLTDDNESSSIYLRKVLVGISEDVRVLIIKLADRLHNMRTADALNEKVRKQKAKETIEVLIPIAHRLGINSIKSELEDLCLKHSKPDIYNEILEKLDGTRESLTSSLEEMKNNISEILTDHEIEFEIKSRLKSVYSIYTKLTTGRKWSDIYDILALRLIVPTESDCYLAVGLIHSKYRSIPKRFKDFIAMPKANMYQSLHTAVFGASGHIFEVQLRTPEMDEMAEHGIASHWSYKEHKSNIQNIMEQKLELFRNIIESNIEEKSDEIFAQNMNEEFLKEQIYVFTPKGDVMELPNGATPIDFAYRIHSGVGDKTVGAIVNDVIVPLNYELNDGDIVKINTSTTAKPSKQWLKFIKTSQAKNKIKSYFSKKDRENYITRGKELLEKEVRKQKLSISEVLSTDNINKVLKDLKISNYDELLLSIGSLRYTAVYIINLIFEDKKSVEDIMLSRVSKISDKKPSYKNDVIVSGTDNILVSMAACCNPVPGNPIIGFVTKGKGVTVHKKDCSNVKNESNRLIDVSWNENLSLTSFYNVKLIIKTNTLNNHILEIVTKASLKNVSITSIKEFNMGKALDYEVTVKVRNNEELDNYIEELNQTKFVLEVIR
ncbi:MAG: RelA/SpoT family protein [Bacilli bacterium]|nr:RelA/SpoT family protein [Bacilli bacterium]MDD4795363.1 RelA/SpoT family protein [Bacilli bacterium]